MISNDITFEDLMRLGTSVPSAVEQISRASGTLSISFDPELNRFSIKDQFGLRFKTSRLIGVDEHDARKGVEIPGILLRIPVTPYSKRNGVGEVDRRKLVIQPLDGADLETSAVATISKILHSVLTGDGKWDAERWGTVPSLEWYRQLLKDVAPHILKAIDLAAAPAAKPAAKQAKPKKAAKQAKSAPADVAAE